MVLRPLSWELVAVWAAVGVASGAAVSDILTRLALLLIPAAVVAGWLLWSAGATRDLGAGLIGLCVGPLLLAEQAQNPPCPTSEFATCEPGPLWPWLSMAALLVLLGAAVLVAPGARLHRQGASD